MKVKPIAFVASPYAATTKEDVDRNVKFAQTVCRRIALETGAMPFAPHLLFPQFLDDHDVFEREHGIAYCSTMLDKSAFAAFFVPEWTPKPSSGMEQELLEVMGQQRLQNVYGIGWQQPTRTLGHCEFTLEGLLTHLADLFPPIARAA